MGCSCFRSDHKRLKKPPTVFHWPNFTFARSQDTFYNRNRHHSIGTYLRHQPSRVSNNAGKKPSYSRLPKRYRREIQPNPLIITSIEGLGNDISKHKLGPRVRFAPSDSSSNRPISELSWHLSRCITQIHSAVLTMLGRNSHNLILLRSTPLTIPMKHLLGRLHLARTLRIWARPMT